MARSPLKVYAEVGSCLKSQIIADSGGIFTEANFHPGLVPSAEPVGNPPKGYGADRENWATTLENTRLRLIKIDQEYYGPFRISEELISGTLGKTFPNITEDVKKAVIAQQPGGSAVA